MKLPLQHIRDFWTPIGPGGRLAVLLLVIGLGGLATITFAARNYIEEKITERESMKRAWEMERDQMRGDVAMLTMEHKTCMRKLADAFKEIEKLKKQS